MAVDYSSNNNQAGGMLSLWHSRQSYGAQDSERVVRNSRILLRTATGNRPGDVGNNGVGHTRLSVVPQNSVVAQHELLKASAAAVGSENKPRRSGAGPRRELVSASSGTNKDSAFQSAESLITQCLSFFSVAQGAYNKHIISQKFAMFHWHGAVCSIADING